MSDTVADSLDEALDDDSLAAQLTLAAEDLHADGLVQRIWDAAVRSALELVQGAVFVCVATLNENGQAITRASSDAAVTTPDPPGLGPVVSFALETRGRETTSLMVYPAHGLVLGRGSHTAALVARHARLALVQARRHENLLAALESRTGIGIALGLVMERMRVDEDTAFAYLTRLSETGERKLRDVAATIVADHVASLPTRPGQGRPATVAS
ncbi:hypothetical protein BH09ACT12_BH09ACT12_06860 [soil metagenome]